MTKPALAAASSRRSISSQGLRLSDSDSAQKSWPSGAPIRAATASIAVMPGTNGDIERAPAFRAGFDFLAYRGRHGEHAGIAARHDRDARALRRMPQRRGGARALFAIVGRMPGLAGARRHAIEIGPVAVERLRVCQRRLGFRREIARIARSQSDDGEVPAHGRSSQPGTSTTAK